MTSSAPLFLQLVDIRKSYASGASGGPFPALRGVSLDLSHGSFTALMGVSGSGKSTLLNIVGGIDAPDSGNVLWEGKDLTPWSDGARSDLRLRSIGTVFQFFHLLPTLSVRRNVEIPLLLMGSTLRETSDRAMQALARVGLAGKEERMPHELSGGEMQRVSIARAIVHRPSLILADEPTGNLDRTNGQAILDLLRSLVDGDKLTVLMATHDLRARLVADATLYLQDGRMVDEASSGLSESSASASTESHP